MLKSYEAIYENGRVIWLDEQPPLTSARLIVTVLEETQAPPVKRRTFPTTLARKVKILGDIVNPITFELFDRIRSLVGNVDVDLDAPLADENE